MLKEDYELSREDIQLLSSRDALAALFAQLGYDTNDCLVQNVAAMGFTSDNQKSAITHIERLASQDARMFEVYLFELKTQPKRTLEELDSHLNFLCAHGSGKTTI